MNVQWKSKYIKHQMLPISDLRINYQLDKEARLLRIDVGHHFDSALLIDFMWRLQRDEGIIAIDTKSHDTWGRARIPDLFRVEMALCGVPFSVEFMQCYRFNMEAPPEITISMHQRKGVAVISGNENSPP